MKIKLFSIIFACLSILNTNAQSNIDDLLSQVTISDAHKKQMKLSRNFSSHNYTVNHYYFDQYIQGIRVYNSQLSIHTNKVGKVIYSNNGFVQSPLTINTSPEVNSSKALISAANHLKINQIGEIFSTKDLLNKQIETLINPKLSNQPIKAELVFLPTNSTIKLAWLINIKMNDEKHDWDIFVDAQTSNVISKFDNVISCNFDGCTDADFHQTHTPTSLPSGKTIRRGSSAKYNVLHIPLESPKHGSFAVQSGNEDSLASPYNWHDINGVLGAEYTITRGNNVHAYEDKSATNQIGYSPDGGKDLIFDYKYHGDFPDSNLNAAITNLFYWNNLMHDVWYHAGFDEKAGNFQQNNYGRHSSGANDYVDAQAQDGSGTNNANFNTQKDGTRSRMQMYIWNRGFASTSYLMRVTSPTSIKRTYKMNTSVLGKKLTSTPLVGNVVIANDLLACNALSNASAMNGNIALIKRGTCAWVDKVKNAQAAGAIAVIMYNNTNAIFTITATDNTITIPVITLSGTDGAAFTTLLNNNPTLKVSLALDVVIKGRDSDLDNGIISHEYGHGISVRLAGGANNTACLRNQEQMGEGWSDFFGLVMTHKSSYTANTGRGIGTYSNGQNTNGRGIRNFPYSRNMTTNPATYDNIKTYSVPHGVGFVWCSMLYDIYWDMIDKHGYDKDLYKGDGGNNKCMKLVILGLKLQPCSPGFVDGRNALLKADTVLYNGVNSSLIWKAFARRGLGYNATQGNSNSRADGAQGFDLPPDVKNTIEISKTAPAEIAAGKEFDYEIIIKNEGTKDFTDVVVRDTVDMDITILKNTLNKGTFTNNILSYTIPVMQANSLDTVRFKAIMPNSKAYDLVFIDSFESTQGTWKTNALTGTTNWALSKARKKSGDQSWFMKNEETRSDGVLSQSFKIPATNPKLEFYHWFNSEDAWDGGVIEISTNGGTNWTDLGSSIEVGKYNGTISTNQQSSLSERNAFTGNSQKFIQCLVDLSPYAGKDVMIRWFFASDARLGIEGWYVDDVRIFSAEHVTNVAHVFSDNKLINSAQVSTLVAPKENSTSINQALLNNINLYPNPGTGKLMINFVQKSTILKVYDSKGALLMTRQLTEGKNSLQLNQYQSGAYFLRFIKNGESSIRTYILNK